MNIHFFPPALLLDIEFDIGDIENMDLRGTYLHQIRNKAVSCHTLDEVHLSTEEAFRVDRAELLDEVGQQGHLAVLLDLVERDGVEDGLDEAAVVAQHLDLVGPDKEGQALRLPDRLEGGQQLVGHRYGQYQF